MASDPAATLEQIRHELANVSLSIDALAAAVASGVTDDETVIRVLDGCRRRLNELREW